MIHINNDGKPLCGIFADATKLGHYEESDCLACEMIWQRQHPCKKMLIPTCCPRQLEFYNDPKLCDECFEEDCAFFKEKIGCTFKPDEKKNQVKTMTEEAFRKYYGQLFAEDRPKQKIKWVGSAMTSLLSQLRRHPTWLGFKYIRSEMRELNGVQTRLWIYLKVDFILNIKQEIKALETLATELDQVVKPALFDQISQDAKDDAARVEMESIMAKLDQDEAQAQAESEAQEQAEEQAREDAQAKDEGHEDYDEEYERIDNEGML